MISYRVAISVSDCWLIFQYNREPHSQIVLPDHLRASAKHFLGLLSYRNFYQSTYFDQMSRCVLGRFLSLLQVFNTWVLIYLKKKLNCVKLFYQYAFSIFIVFQIDNGNTVFDLKFLHEDSPNLYVLSFSE